MVDVQVTCAKLFSEAVASRFDAHKLDISDEFQQVMEVRKVE